jgi:hypothetical protein
LIINTEEEDQYYNEVYGEEEYGEDMNDPYF